MMHFRRLLVVSLLGLMVAACATGPEFSTIQSSIPTISEDSARIFFFRSGSPFGGAIQPDIRLNGKVVGESVPGGVFFTDVKPGKYAVSTSTEVKRTLTFVLAESETKYVRTSVSLGVFVGHVYPELADRETAKKEIPTLSYTGKKLK